MNVAILVPEESARSKETNSRLPFVSGLTEALRAAEYDLSVITIPSGKDTSSTILSLTSLEALNAFFSKAEGFDLIHNLIGMSVLYLYPNPAIPVLTTLFEPPDETTLSLIHSPPPRFFFTATELDIPLGGPNSLGMIHPSKIEEDILSLYEKIHALTRREDHRPWGYYVVLADEADHKVKRIVVYPGKRLSLQRHQRRSEHWHVIQGKALVTLDDQRIPLKAGESVDIPRGTAHRVQNPADGQDLAFIEVQRGDYFGEDDIERIEDDYGRA